MSDPLLGARVGAIEIQAVLGEGGMGRVYLGEHAVLGTKRVIKVLLPELTRNAVVVQRFINEAKAAASIEHRNIIGVQDVGQLPDGTWYIVMDYLEGVTLRGFLRLQGGAVAIPVALELLAQIANALGAAHARGIIHRDLKPENVFLTTRDRNERHVVLLDFGVAKLDDQLAGSMTRTGQAIGTPAYMPPEQLRGAKVDLTCDVFALGVIAYQLVTGGYLPFQDDGRPEPFYDLPSAEIYHRQMTRPPTDPRARGAAVPEGWARAILAALDRDPAARPATARAFALQLAEVTAGSGHAADGVAIVRRYARELLDPDNLLDTARAPAREVVAAPAPSSRYQVGDRLGTGGMAEVYRGTMVGAEGFAREVAIKRVLVGYSEAPEFAAMFVDEARLASRLAHPNIVSVLDFDRDPEGHLFLVMELVEGKDLAALAASGTLPPAIAIFVIAEVLRGLGYAHELPHPKTGGRGLIHRDVSPHNVLLSWQGAVKVSDFGIAKALEASGAVRSATIKGKPSYMSPEQAGGEPLDARSDLFAAGIMLWELLAGRQLFQGTVKETLAQVLFKDIPRPSSVRAGVPADVEAVAMKLLARDKAARYASADEAIEDLARCADNPRNGRGDLVRLLAARFPAEARRRSSTPPEPRAAVAMPAQPSRLGGPYAEPRAAVAMPAQSSRVGGSFAEPRAAVAMSAQPGRVETLALAGQVDRADTPAMPGSRPGTMPGLGRTDAPMMPGPPSTLGAAASQSTPLAAPRAGGAKRVVAIGAAATVAVAAVVVALAMRPGGDRSGAAAAGDDARAAVDASIAARADVDAGAGAGTGVTAGDARVTVDAGAVVADARVAPIAVDAAVAPVAVDAGATRRKRASGTLVVKVTPWAEVRIAGRSRGQTPVRATLPAGRYSVTITNDGKHKSETIRVTIEPGKQRLIERDWRQ